MEISAHSTDTPYDRPIAGAQASRLGSITLIPTALEASGSYLSSPESKALYIVRGTDGSGMRGLAKALCPMTCISPEYCPVETDNDRAVEWCLQQVKVMMDKGFASIAVHSNFCTRASYRGFIKLAARCGYEARVIHAEGMILEDIKQVVESEEVKAQQQSWETHNPELEGAIATRHIQEAVAEVRDFVSRE